MTHLRRSFFYWPAEKKYARNTVYQNKAAKYIHRISFLQLKGWKSL